MKNKYFKILIKPKGEATSEELFEIMEFWKTSTHQETRYGYKILRFMAHDLLS